MFFFNIVQAYIRANEGETIYIFNADNALMKVSLKCHLDRLVEPDASTFLSDHDHHFSRQFARRLF